MASADLCGTEQRPVIHIQAHHCCSQVNRDLQGSPGGRCFCYFITFPPNFLWSWKIPLVVSLRKPLSIHSGRAHRHHWGSPLGTPPWARAKSRSFLLFQEQKSSLSGCKILQSFDKMWAIEWQMGTHNCSLHDTNITALPQVPVQRYPNIFSGIFVYADWLVVGHLYKDFSVYYLYPF